MYRFTDSRWSFWAHPKRSSRSAHHSSHATANKRSLQSATRPWWALLPKLLRGSLLLCGPLQITGHPVSLQGIETCLTFYSRTRLTSHVIVDHPA